MLENDCGVINLNQLDAEACNVGRGERLHSLKMNNSPYLEKMLAQFRVIITQLNRMKSQLAHIILTFKLAMRRRTHIFIKKQLTTTAAPLAKTGPR